MDKALILLLLAGSLHAQIVQQVVMSGAPTVVSATPTLVNLRASSSTGTTALGAKVDNTCATNAYCVQLPDASLPGNTLIVALTYSFATTQVPTPTDDKTNTWTHCSSEAHDVASTRWADVFYVTNAATGTRAITVTFPAAVTHAAVIVSQWANAQTFDGCNANSALLTTSMTAGSITSTANGDLYYSAFFTTTTALNVGAFTAGTNATFGLESADRRDGAASESGIQTSSGALNPDMTIGSTNGYVAVGIAFKAATQGTAPSGMYVARIQAQSTTTAGTGPFSFQMPSTGNLLYIGAQCGGTGPMLPSSISDGTNTWVPISPVLGPQAASTEIGRSFYVGNATSSRTLAYTATTSGTGDCTFMSYDIVGAATAPLVGHLDDCIGGSSTLCTSTSTSATGNLTVLTNYYPGTIGGMNVGTIGVGQNTQIGATAPSGSLFDSSTTGGETIDGPYPVDENNGWLHGPVASNAAVSWTWTQSLSSRTTSLWVADANTFLASGGTVRPNHLGSAVCESTSAGTTLTCTVTPIVAGHTLVIGASTIGTTGTMAITDGGAGNTIVTDVTATTITAVGRMAGFHIASVNTTSPITFTLTLGTSSAFKEVFIDELNGTYSFDVGNVGVATASGGLFSSPSVTTTAANEYVFGWCLASNACTFGSGFSFGRQDNGHGQVSEFKVLTSTGANTADFSGASGSNGGGIMAFK